MVYAIVSGHHVVGVAGDEDLVGSLRYCNSEKSPVVWAEVLCFVNNDVVKAGVAIRRSRCARCPTLARCGKARPYPNSYPNQLGATISADEQTSRSASISGYPNSSAGDWGSSGRGGEEPMAGAPEFLATARCSGL